jgi:hypothetical protein
MSEADYYGAEIDKYTEHLLESICSVGVTCPTIQKFPHPVLSG